MTQLTMFLEELSDNDQDEYTLGAREPSFNLDSTTNPGSLSQVSAFLNSINLPFENGIIQPSMDQRSDMNNSLSPNIADTTMDTTNFYEENNLSTIKESDLCSSPSSETTSPSDFTINNEQFTNQDYRSKRERNNIAVRKSRVKAKSKRVSTQRRVSQLKEENKQLEEQIKTLVHELKLCRSLFIKKGSPVPGQLQSMLDTGNL